MAKLKQLKEQHKSVKSINKITKAMKLVSTAKAQKALNNLKSYKEYYLKVQQIINNIASDVVQQKDFKGTVFVIFTSDLGLVGGYNNNILKIIRKEFNLKTDKVVVIGQKGNTFIKELKYKNFPKDNFIFITSANFINSKNMTDIVVKLLKDYFENGLKIIAIYTKYLSQISFEAKIQTLLPIEIPKEVIKSDALTEYEPEKQILLKEILVTYLESVLLGYYFESITSEYTSRRSAMENATKNGDEMLQKIMISFNRERQAKITQEISEIIGGAEALS